MNEQKIRKHKRKHKNDVFAMNEVVFWSGQVAKEVEKELQKEDTQLKEKS